MQSATTRACWRTCATDYLDEDIYEYCVVSKIENTLYNIILRTIINQFEIEVYGAETPYTADDYAGIIARFSSWGQYPWTRLGYTYDWGAEDEYGLTEFLVLKNSTIEVEFTKTIDEFFDWLYDMAMERVEDEEAQAA